jgi:hypothetical protein
MHSVNRVSNRVAFPIFFFSLLIAGVFGVSLYLGTAKLVAEMRPLLQTAANKASGAQAWNLVLFYYPRFWFTVFPALLLLALFAGLLTWLIVRSRVRRLKPTSEKKADIAAKGGYRRTPAVFAPLFDDAAGRTVDGLFGRRPRRV